ncbi:MAG: hypothetical protein ACRC9P_03655 [Bacteroides sp.]
MSLSSTSKESIKNSIQTAIKELQNRDEQPLVTDIYLQPNTDTASLLITDDNDTVLATAQVEEWSDNNNDNFLDETAIELRNLLQQEKNNKVFKDLDILKPYSFVLIDEDGETQEELLYIDDDILIVNEELLKGLDEELDDFLKHLLED